MQTKFELKYINKSISTVEWGVGGGGRDMSIKIFHQKKPHTHYCNKGLELKICGLLVLHYGCQQWLLYACLRL